MPRKDDFLSNFGANSQQSGGDTPEPYSEEVFFLEKVAPLLAQLKELCEERNLPVVATVSYEYVEGLGYHAAVLAHLNNNPQGRVPIHFPIVYHIANGAGNGVD